MQMHGLETSGRSADIVMAFVITSTQPGRSSRTGLPDACGLQSHTGVAVNARES